MRRKDREVTDPAIVEKILQESSVCHLAMARNNIPYVVPLNYGYIWEDGRLILLFHSAKAGKKLDILEENPRVFFSISMGHELIQGERPCDTSMRFSCLMGEGEAEILREAGQIREIMELFMKNYPAPPVMEWRDSLFSHMACIRVTVTDWSCKVHP